MRTLDQGSTTPGLVRGFWNDELKGRGSGLKEQELQVTFLMYMLLLW
jgi:hypothetical protein